MRIEVNVEVKETSGLLAKLLKKRFEDKADKLAKGIAIDVMEFAQSNIVRSGTRYKGELEKGFVINKIDKGKYEVVNNVIYAPFIEHGRGMRGDGTFPSQQRFNPYAIKQWVIGKLGIPPDEAEDVTFAIIRVMKEDGMYAQPFLLPAVKIVKELMKDRDYERYLIRIGEE